MNTRLLHTLLCAGVLTVAIFSALTYTASADTQTIYVRLASGQVVPVTVDVPPGASLNDIQLPGTPVPAPTTPTVPSAPGSPKKPSPPKADEPTPVSPGGTPQKPSTDTPDKKKKKKKKSKHPNGGTDAGPLNDVKKKVHRHLKKTPLRNPDGSPTAQNPGFVDALPGPSRATGVPNFVIRKFRVPIFLLPLYQAAGIQYGVRWEVLAAINEIETDYGRNLNVSTAGALGWMQFMPATWRQWGVDANKDKRKDPYNPADAIFAAARYLKAAGYEKDPRRAIFAYNHADWYVDSVMLRARLISGVPADLVGSLTGLTEARFPVYARARYADDLAERQVLKRAKTGQNAANLVESKADRTGIHIFAKTGSPVIATNDGVIKKVGRSKRLGRFLVLQDVYGNRFTYGHLGTVARFYPVPKVDAQNPRTSARAVKANGSTKEAAPKLAASAGRQPDSGGGKPAKKTRRDDTQQASAPIKERLFAHPDLPGARDNGGMEQLLDSKASKGGFSTFRTYFSQPFGMQAKDVRLRRLKKGAHVIGGTILGRIGKTVTTEAPHLMFEIRPAGRGAPRIDPKPILDGWKLLEATAIYRASGRNVLHGDDTDGMSIGQVLLLPKPQLQKRVLADDRIDIYPCGREDVRTGQIDRRVLATLEYLAESGFKPTVSALKCGHSLMTSSGNISEHSSGNAVDISKVNGIPIIGHQDKGGITDQAVHRLMALQGTMEPHQIISLLDFGRNTMALPDHNDHIHVGFRPLFGENKKLGKQAFEVLRPGQWSDLLSRLRKIDNPVVPTKPSKYAIPVKPKRASDAHQGE
jgi:murein DD-endopeptidase MepM/ murein hydrolase activator NlpD